MGTFTAGGDFGDRTRVTLPSGATYRETLRWIFVPTISLLAYLLLDTWFWAGGYPSDSHGYARFTHSIS
jgi:hypothetical protein